QHGARTNGEARGVARADDLLAFDCAAGQRTAVVGADVLDRMIAAVEVEHRDECAVDLDHPMRAGRQLLDGGDIDPVGHFKASPAATSRLPSCGPWSTADPRPARPRHP